MDSGGPCRPDRFFCVNLLWRVYAEHGVTGWNLLADDGSPLPLTPANVTAALPYGKGGRLVAEKADDLYAQDVLAPFVERNERLQRLLAGSTNGTRKATSRPLGVSAK